MSTIFISHSSQDNDIAREIGRRLDEQEHHSVFLDIDPEKGIVGGQSWERTLYRKLRACRVVIALCTDHYLDSHWCFAEIALARMEGKHIIALQADPLDEQAKMPAILTERQFIDLRRDGDEVDQRMRKALKALDGPVGPDLEPNESPYLGLSAYQEKHASVYFGREEESRAGIELLDRGAPGLIMVLGASGSGKSSLVRAGMLPRLSSRKDEWLIVDPFRPGRDPLAELTESLVQSYRRYAPEHAPDAENRERIRERLRAGLRNPSISVPLAADESEGQDQMPAAAEDERLRRLMDLLERLQEDPPPLLAGQLRDYLEWSLDDLRRICGERAAVVSSPEIISDYTTPLIEIAHDLRRVSQRRGARVLLVIDQFEELLGRKKTDEEAGHFLALLRASIEADHSSLMVLGTMRSDFLGLFQRNAALRGIDFESLSLGPMKIEGMRRVIEEPAKRAATELENGLADLLLEDTETPDALPLLSFTLWLLWKDYRRDGKLEKSAYKQLGGLYGAIAREADALLASTKREGQEAGLRQAFLRMVRLTEEGRYARVPMDLDAEELSPIRPILERFVNRHLLVTRGEEGGSRTVEVAHEALFRSWEPLKTWIDNHRAELILKQQLRRDAHSWKENNRAAAFLWRGGRLEQAQELLQKGKLRDADARRGLQSAFVRAGIRRRQRQRWTWGGLTFCVFAVLAVFLVIALVQKERADDQKNLAEQQSRVARGRLARYFAKESIKSLKDSPTLSLLLAVGAVNASSVADAEQALRQALMKTGGMPLHGQKDQVTIVAFSPDGEILATGSKDGTARLWDLKRPEVPPLELPGYDDRSSALAFSPDGEILAMGSKENTVWLWDLKQPKSPPRVTPHFRGIKKIAFSPDGGKLVVVNRYTRLISLDLKQPEAVPQPSLGSFKSIVAFRFIPDNGALITASLDGKVELWDLELPEAKLLANLPEHISNYSKLAFSPDGGTLATANRGKGVLLWDLKQREAEPQVLSEDNDNLNSLEFSPDGAKLIADLGKTLELWDLEQPEAKPRELRGHDGNATALAFSPDGGVLATGGEDKVVRLWDLRRQTAEPRQVQSGRFWPWTLLLGIDGETLMRRISDHSELNLKWQETVSDAIMQVWTLGSLRAFAFSPDGKMIAAEGKNGKVRLWDLNQPAAPPREPLPEPKDDVTALALSPDDGTLATGSEVGKVQLWDLKQRKSFPLKLMTEQKEGILALRFSPDGEMLAAMNEDGRVQLWDLKQIRSKPHVFPEHEPIELSSVLFSPDGKILATGSKDGVVRLWDLKRLEKEPQLLPGHKFGVLLLAFSPDGDTLATSEEGAVRLWDLKQPEAMPRVLPEHGSDLMGIAFSGNGSTLVTGDVHKGVVWLWDLDGLLWGVPNDELIARACERAGRNLTLDEWRQLLGDETYSKFCDGQPLASDFVAKGRKMAQDGDIDGALEYFQATLSADAGPNPDIATVNSEARRLVAPVFVKMGRELARKGKIDPAITEFNKALELDPGLKLVAETEARRFAAPFFIEQAKDIAQSGNIQGAIVGFKKALEFDPNLELDAEIEARRLAAPYFVKQGKDLARLEKISEAIAEFRRAQELDPNLELDAEAEARQLAAQTRLSQGIELARKGEIEDALEAFEKAQKYLPTLNISAENWNTFCWSGSLWGYAAAVMNACENAVKLAPEDSGYRDSRGVARALIGDYSGAVDDLEYFVKERSKGVRTSPKIEQRKNWIKVLNNEQNPFDAATLEALR